MYCESKWEWLILSTLSNMFFPNICLLLDLYAPTSLTFKINFYKLCHVLFVISVSCIICRAIFCVILHKNIWWRFYFPFKRLIKWCDHTKVLMLLPFRYFIFFTNIFKVLQINFSVCDFNVCLFFLNAHTDFTLGRFRYEVFTILPWNFSVLQTFHCVNNAVSLNK